MNDVTGISFNKNLEWFKLTLANGEEIDLVKKKDYLKLEQENQRLKERIDKAIEYIEKDYKFANYDIPLLTKDEQLAGKLLEILKGEDNE